uniref:Homeobox-containing protein n=1 Tax=Strongyloides papillosus TaxID=174720 RepID=A0A0N5CIS9_STREA
MSNRIYIPEDCNYFKLNPIISGQNKENNNDLVDNKDSKQPDENGQNINNSENSNNSNNDGRRNSMALGSAVSLNMPSNYENLKFPFIRNNYNPSNQKYKNLKKTRNLAGKYKLKVLYTLILI